MTPDGRPLRSSSRPLSCTTRTITSLSWTPMGRAAAALQQQHPLRRLFSLCAAQRLWAEAATRRMGHQPPAVLWNMLWCTLASSTTTTTTTATATRKGIRRRLVLMSTLLKDRRRRQQWTTALPRGTSGIRQRELHHNATTAAERPQRPMVPPTPQTQAKAKRSEAASTPCSF